MEEQFILTFPMYSLLLKDGTGIMYLRHDKEIWLPLFTDQAAVETYLERSDIKESIVQELPSPASLGAFLRNPPSRSGRNDVTWVVIDPVDPGPRTVTLLTVQQLLVSLSA
jgi:hypothetical protein